MAWLLSHGNMTKVRPDVRPLFFWKSGEEYGFLSQWYPCTFTVDNVTYNCAEQFMMAQKAKLFNDHDTYAKIMATNDPKLQKALGRVVCNYSNATWTEHRFDIVLRGTTAKFNQNAHLKNMLLETGSRFLAEASPDDKIWGIGIGQDHVLAKEPTKWPGTNHLGRILMTTRANLVGL